MVDRIARKWKREREPPAHLLWHEVLQQLSCLELPDPEDQHALLPLEKVPVGDAPEPKTEKDKNRIRQLLKALHDNSGSEISR